jgi:tetratricopeptide (TPR) repeat protein
MRSKWIAAVVATFVLGVSVGAWAAKKGLDASVFAGKKPKEAASSLLEVARTQAGKGSWENIAVGRAYYLGGMKTEGQAIFDQVTSKKPEASDWIRIGRVYYQAGEWNKAKATFDKVLETSPKDAAWLAEIGAYYNLKGDRSKAEELFTRSLKEESGEVWNTVDIAGSYVGITPVR